MNFHHWILWECFIKLKRFKKQAQGERVRDYSIQVKDGRNQVSRKDCSYLHIPEYEKFNFQEFKLKMLHFAKLEDSLVSSQPMSDKYSVKQVYKLLARKISKRKSSSLPFCRLDGVLPRLELLLGWQQKVKFSPMIDLTNYQLQPLLCVSFVICRMKLEITYFSIVLSVPLFGIGLWISSIRIFHYRITQKKSLNPS